jgi:muramidase (phage lysozyme)
MAEVVSKNGRKMSPVATRTVTPVKDSTPKTVSLDAKQQVRRAENEEFLKNKNVKAFLDTIAESEGGNYHAKFGYGWAPGFKTGKWTFTDESTHPGAGYGGSTTASGRYQITMGSWRDYCIAAMGLSDFTPHTQDLTAIEILRRVRAIDSLVSGDIKDAVQKASRQWESLPMGPGQANRPLNGHPSGQPYMPYDDVLTTYKKFGGTTK